MQVIRGLAMKLGCCAPFMLLLGALGCGSVQPADIPGTWVMRDTSRSLLPTALREASARVVFDVKGTFTASEMPALFDVLGRRPVRLESGHGTWKIVSIGGEQRVQLEFSEIADWSNNEVPYWTELRVSGQSPSLHLYYYVGDPDKGTRVAFEKR